MSACFVDKRGKFINTYHWCKHTLSDYPNGFETNVYFVLHSNKFTTLSSVLLYMIIYFLGRTNKTDCPVTKNDEFF